MSVHPHVSSSTWTLVSGRYLQQVTFGPTNQFQVAIQYNGSSPQTVVYSRDFGVTWEDSTGITGNVNSISSIGQYVLVGVNSVASHLYYSDTYGTSFVVLTNSPVSYWSVVAMSQYSNAYMVACDYANDTSTIYYSSDTGNSWSTLTSYSGVIIEQGAWSNNDSMNTMYFVGYATSSPYFSSLFITTDNGTSWTTLPDYSAYNIQGVACDLTGQYAVISVSQDGVYRSIDYGATWNKITAPSSAPSGPSMGSIVCDMTGNRIVALDTSGLVLYASSDAGTTWVLQDTPNSNTASDYFKLSMSPDGSYCSVSFLGLGLYSTIIPSYKTVNFSNGMYYPLSFVACNNYSGQHMVAVGTTQYGNNRCIVYSSDYGLTWNLSDADASGDSTYTCLAASANGRYVVAGFSNGPHGVVFSNNYGIHYNIVTTGFSFIPSAITISNDGEFFYAMTADNTGLVYVGTLQGSVVVINMGVPNMFWNSVACSSTNGQYVYATTQDGGTNAHHLYKTQFGIPYAHLPLNDTVADVMGNSVVTVTGSPSYVDGMATPHALYLNNASNTGGVPSNYVVGTIDSIPSSFTVSCYFNVQSYPITGQTIVYSLGDSSTACFYLTIQQDGTADIQMYAANTSYPTIPLGSISLDTWYSSHTTFNPSGTCFTYLNGVLVGSIQGTPLYATPTRYSLSSYTSGPGGSFNGYIDDFKLYFGEGTFGMWTQIPQFSSSALVPLVVSCDSSGDVVTVAAGTDGVYHSTNGGVTWNLSDVLTTSKQTITPQLSGLSSNSWTSNAINWNSSASSFVNSYYAPWILFDANYNLPSSTPYYSWASNGNYDTVTGMYNNTYSTTVLGSVGTVYGEWVQLQSSTPLVMDTYSFACGGYGNLPHTYYIVGSNDGTNWYPIQSAVMTANACNCNFTAFNNFITVNYNGSQAVYAGIITSVITTIYPTTSTPYSYFRLIATSTFGIDGNFELEEWRLTFIGSPAPFIELPLTNSILDINNNSVLTSYGSMAYVSCPNMVNALNLSNTAGGTANNYLTGTCAIGSTFTVDMSFNLQSLPASDGQSSVIFMLGTGSQALFQIIYLTLSGYTGLYIQYYDSTNTDSSIAHVPSISPSTWYHLKAIFTPSGACSVYLNDSLINTVTGNGLATTPTLFSIGGATFNNANAMNGYINDLRVYTTNATTPFLELRFDAAIADVNGNSTITTYGNLMYMEGVTETYALNLANTAGDVPSHYLQGTFTYVPNFTATGWFNLQSMPTNGVSHILTFGTTSQTFLMLSYCQNVNLYGVSYFTGLVAWGYDSTNTPFVIGTQSVTNSVWYSFQLTYEQSGMMSVYLNNERFGTIPGSALLNTPTIYSMGSLCHAASGALNGYLSDIRIYNAGLSASTRRVLTKVASDSTGTNLVVGDDSFSTVFRSADSGASWSHQIIDNVGSDSIQSVSIDPTGTYVFASYEYSGAFMSQRSSGLTTNWTVKNGVYYPIATYSNNNQYQTAITTQYGFTSSGHSVISYSTDSGATWTQGPDMAGYVLDLKANSTGQYVVAVMELDMSSSPSIYRSTDYGATFTALVNSPNYNQTGLNCIACDSSGQHLYAGAYDGYVYVSTNAGVDWSFPIQLPYYVYNIICSHSGQYVYALAADQICISTNYGQTWSSPIVISMSGCDQIACDWTGQYLVGACYSDGVYRSTDYGQTWTKTSAPSTLARSGAQNYYFITCNSTGNRILTFDINNGTVYLSTDAGSTWTLQYTPDSQTSEAFMGISMSPDGTRYSAAPWAPGTFFLTAGSPDIPNAIPCFLEGTQILCQVAGVDTYVNVETIRPGMLVKTSRDGYKAVKLIGSRSMTNPGTADRNKNSLYLCTKEAYPELTADVTITGCHAILVDKITDAQRTGIISTLNRVFVTDKKYRLPACVDERASVVPTAGAFTVWHFALDHYDTRMNYGVYAQGLLVESSPICHMNTKNYNLVQ